MMEKLREANTTEQIEAALLFLGVRLEGHPMTAPLAREIQAELDRLRPAAQAYQQALASRRAASSELDYLDNVLDRLVLDLAIDLLGAREGDRLHPDYRALFERSPGEAMAGAATPDQDRYVLGVLSALEARLELSDMHDRVPAIRDALAHVITCRDRRQELYMEESRRAVAIQLARESAARLYNSMYSRVFVLLPQQERLVASFFSSPTH
jgi:hypothetical protein